MRFWRCLVVYFCLFTLFIPNLAGEPSKTLCLLLHDGVYHRAMIACCPEGRRKASFKQTRYGVFRGLLDVDGGVVTGGAGRFWIVGGDSARLIQFNITSGRSRFRRLRRYETKEGGYWPRGALALSDDRLILGHNYGASLIDSNGRTVRDLKCPVSIDYKASYNGYLPVSKMAQEDFLDIISDFPGYRLVPFATDGKLVGAFNDDFLVLLDQNLRPKVTFSFSHLKILGVSPLTLGNWLVLGKDEKRRKFWMAVVKATGGKQKPTLLSTEHFAGVSSELTCDMAATESRIWALVGAEGRREPMTLLAWRTDGTFRGVAFLPGIERLIAGSGKYVYTVESKKGKLKVVEREGVSLEGVRSWGIPSGNWKVRAVTFRGGNVCPWFGSVAKW